jgi:threonine dehydratase
MQALCLSDLLTAQRRIAGLVEHTPLLRCDALDAATGARAFVKAENLQRYGAFKARGAANAIASLTPEERARGIVAFSSGNHAAAVAGQARAFGAHAIIVMPADAPAAKIANTRELGAEVVLYDRVKDDREAIARGIAGEAGRPIVPPFDHPAVIAGQGTVGLEIAAQLGERGLMPDVALVCASGGGLVAGVTIALKAAHPDVRAFAVEPAGHERIAKSQAVGERVANAPGIRSICDALMAEKMGALPFVIAQSNGIGALSVSNDEVKEAMRFAFRHLRLVLEPGGAAALAAALAGKIDARGQTLAIVASGGNVDAEFFSDVLRGA